MIKNNLFLVLAVMLSNVSPLSACPFCHTQTSKMVSELIKENFFLVFAVILILFFSFCFIVAVFSYLFFPKIMSSHISILDWQITRMSASLLQECC